MGAFVRVIACAQATAACSMPWGVLTLVVCVVQVNLSTLLTGLGDGSLLCPTSSALGATVARSDAYDRATQDLARVQTDNVKLRAEVDRLNGLLRAEVDRVLPLRTENSALQDQLRRARAQLQRSTSSVLGQLDATTTAAENMQSRAENMQTRTENEHQLRLQRADQQHQQHLAATQQQVQQQVQLHAAAATAQLCNHSDRSAVAQALSAQVTAQLQARVAALEQECKDLRAKLTAAVDSRHSDVPTFAFLCSDGQATMRGDGTDMPGKRWHNIPGASAGHDNYSRPYLEDDAPRWVDIRVRHALRRQFQGFIQQACIITGWDQHATHVFKGNGGKVGAILARMLWYAPDDGTDTHGTFRIDHVLTALLSSMPAQRHLPHMAATNARLAQVLRQVVGPILFNPPAIRDMECDEELFLSYDAGYWSIHH